MQVTLQVNELFLIGGGIIGISSWFVGIKLGLNGTKKLVKAIDGNVKELLANSNKHETAIVAIKQHCVDTHGEQFQQ